jgi:hypothetical protein
MLGLSLYFVAIVSFLPFSMSFLFYNFQKHISRGLNLALAKLDERPLLLLLAILP